MFDNKTRIYHFNYILELDSIIKAVCNLSFDIGVQIEEINFENEDKEIEYAKDLFEESFLKELDIRKSDLEKNKYNKEEFFDKIVNHYNNNLFFTEKIIEELEGSIIYLIDKKETYLLAQDDKKTIKDRIVNAIKKAGILQDIINRINNSKIKKSLSQINLFEHTALYGKTISLEKEPIPLQPTIPYIEYSFLDEEKIKTTEEDIDNYWFNNKLFNKLYKIDLQDIQELYKVVDNQGNNVLGFKINDYFLPYKDQDLLQFIKEDNLFNYYWNLIELSYSNKTNKLNNQEKLVSDFKEIIASKELNQLLSYLKSNLYIPSNIKINNDFKPFFDEVALLNELEHLDDYEFMISQNDENKTALGIYSTTKIGTSYNLLHWLNHKTKDSTSHFRGNGIKSKKKTLVSALKPEISFYFLEKYFEDLLEKILTENKYSFLSNINLGNRQAKFSCEIDFLVKGNNKIYYIEAKTKLSKYYIEEFLKKASKIIDLFGSMIKNKIDIEFILLAGYSDDTVKDFQFFINSEQDQENYNTTREGLNSVPYKFKVPIPDKKAKEITCIAEPQYDNLTQLLLQVCPK
ncbi:hypothetical protein HBA12_07085 [Tenacibaculum mesophilum]|uniref:NERD domain-containing protein n=1 Tax=Tenacibaculum mesophilum TaxID=104268 RepID=UPI0014302BC4|nr:hypothetical protein [Tenacibaculum mesophilum]KAF9659992.1 hypothetical protein HBA12_07085 [Tenacibaculum mesophilum]